MSHLIVDLETNSRNPNKADIKVFGAYHVEKDKYYIIKYDKEQRGRIKALINSVTWVITFYGQDYDLPILSRHKIAVPFWKHIDLHTVVKKRALLIRKGGFQSLSLKNIIKDLELDTDGKGDIDYEVFKKDLWDDIEIKKITAYLKQDLLLTYKLWVFLRDRFESFREFISPKDGFKHKHITSSAGAYAYKVICFLAGLPEHYCDDDGYFSFQGAYVSEPSVEEARGLFIDFDFASLYPMMAIQGNLFKPCTSCTQGCSGWNGGDHFKASGTYCDKEQGKIEKVIKQLYMLKKQYKEDKDDREGAVKIVINSLYGISGSPKFMSLFNVDVAPDITAFGRECIKYARKRLNEEGFDALYSDTDSVFIRIPDHKTKEDAFKVANDLSLELCERFPFPWREEFKLTCDAVIKYIQFFHDKDNKLLKKNYLFVDEDDKLHVVGLQVIRRDCSAVSTIVFNDVLKPLIIDGLDCKFDRNFILLKIHELLSKDLTLAAKRFNIKKAKDYTSKTSIQWKILTQYGEGEIELIKNKRFGAGTGVKYCTIEEASKLSIEDIDIDTFMKELEPFIKYGDANVGGLLKYGNL